jgi:hypothetical protein
MERRVAGKRGKLAAEMPMLGTLEKYMKPHFPTPPRSFDYSNRVAEYPMALNDQLGDCTIAGVIHMLQLAYAEIGEVFEYPGDDEVKATYLKLSGGADNGLVEHNVLQAWLKDGLFSNKITAYVPVNIKNRKEMAFALYSFGSLYLGVEMPANAEQQFEAHENWHVTEDHPQPVGGHCVVATGMNAFGIDCITWGALQSMTWSWWDSYGIEAWVAIPEIFIEANHGPLWHFDILSLCEDLKNL